MSQYGNLYARVLSVFANPLWLATGIATYPANFVAETGRSEFIRVSVISSGNSGNVVSGSGVVLIDIFTPSGMGQRRAFEIADKLDEHLAAKTLSTDRGNLQFQKSSSAPFGVDSDNEGLYRVSYSIPFLYFGVY